MNEPLSVSENWDCATRRRVVLLLASAAGTILALDTAGVAHDMVDELRAALGLAEPQRDQESA